MIQDRLTAWQLFYIVCGTLGSFNFYLSLDEVIESSGTSTYLVILVVGVAIGLLCIPLPAVMTGEDGKSFAASHLTAFGKIAGVPLLILLAASLLLVGSMMLNEMMLLLDRYQTPNLQYYWIAVPLMIICAVVAASGGVRVLAGLFFIVICTRVLETVLLVFGVSPYFELRSTLPLWSGIPRQPATALSNGTALYSGIEVLLFLRLYTAGLRKRAVRGSIWAAVGVQCAFLMIWSWSMLGIFGIEGINLVDLTTIDYYKLMSYPFLEQMDEVGISIDLFWILAALSLTLSINASLLREVVFRKWPVTAHNFAVALLLLGVGVGLWEMRWTQILQEWYPIVLLVLLCAYIPLYALLHARTKKSGPRASAGAGGEGS